MDLSKVRLIISNLRLIKSFSMTSSESGLEDGKLKQWNKRNTI